MAYSATLDIDKIGKDYSAHGTINSIDSLKPCPFCGSTELEVWNTHTPVYTVECACGASMRGACAEDGKIRSKKRLIDLHFDAISLAVEAWNKRAS